MVSDQQLTVRQQLDECWSFLDNLGSPENKYLVCTSVKSIDDVEVSEISYIYYCRHNDVLVIPIDKGWRQFENVKNGKIFSFLVANSEALSEKGGMEKYSRLTIRSKIDFYLQKSQEYEKFWSIYKAKTPYDELSEKNTDTVLYMGIVRPTFMEYSVRSERFQEQIKGRFKSEVNEFDEEGQWIGKIS